METDSASAMGGYFSVLAEPDKLTAKLSSVSQTGLTITSSMTVSWVFSFQVRVYDLLQYEHGPDDVLILATDGLWDVLLNEEVAEAVTNFLPNCDPDDPHRFVLVTDFIASP